MTATITEADWLCPDSTEILPYGAHRNQWLAERRAGIGGSDLAAILGMSRWDSPRDIWLDKTGRASTDKDSWAIRRGNALEEPLLAWFWDQTGIRYERVGMQRNTSRPWMLVNPDALTEDGGLAECKTTSWYLRDEWADGAADYAVIQGQWGLAVTGRSHLWVIAAVSDDEPVIERVERDDDLIATLIDAAGPFWHEYVVADVEPPLTWLDRDTLAEAYPEVVRHRVDGNADLDYAISMRQQAVADIKRAEQVKAKHEADIIAALADADHLVIDGMIAATRKQQTARVVDMSALAAALDEAGDCLDNYRIERESRVLRIADPAKRKEWKA